MQGSVSILVSTDSTDEHLQTAPQESSWVSDVLDACADIREEAGHHRGEFLCTGAPEIRRYERKHDERRSDDDECVINGHEIKVRSCGEPESQTWLLNDTRHSFSVSKADEPGCGLHLDCWRSR
ncbi:hypothetical protein M404DRAFT_1006833 [Pisolithus tinctorius Marx 270]|uniref:Uncharacterized protein n=1 Tax=Pisolithus tinctorius Marx 270 TaxID=870435 RepID=A0A0C3NM24_PISTI|nr:hypothetical protein M404DRAFT_1006833 [Pisolithus tinctorius Marx 270]